MAAPNLFEIFMYLTRIEFIYQHSNL